MLDSPSAQRQKLQQLRTVADLLDKKYLDPILGLVIPGVGDGLGALFGLYIVFAAWKMGFHSATIARMLVHLGVDALLGSVPVLGFVADFFYRANVRNLELIERRLDAQSSPSVPHSIMGDPKPAARASDYLALGVAALFFVGALVLPLLLTGAILLWFIRQF